MTAYQVFITDSDLNPLGQFVDEYTKLEWLGAFNRPDATALTLPDSGPIAELAVAGNRLVVMRQAVDTWKYLTGGPIERPSDFSWSADSDEDAEPGQRIIYATDDGLLPACRAIYPDPAHAWTAQTSARYTISAVNAEVAMRALVNLNAGPGAVAARQVPNLVLGALASVGSNVSASFRMEPLGDGLRALALAGGGLGYRFIQAGTTIEFQVYAPVDRSDTVRYSRALGNLRKIKYSATAPNGTVALVGGDGTGTSRTARERENTGATAVYGRREVFVNSGSGTNAELDQAGDNALVDQGETARLEVVAIDTAAQQFGRDYNLGDRVSVEVIPGLLVTDVVSAVRIVYEPDTGEVVQPQIGSGAPTTHNATLAALRDLSQRLGVVERTA